MKQQFIYNEESMKFIPLQRTPWHKKMLIIGISLYVLITIVSITTQPNTTHTTIINLEELKSEYYYDSLFTDYRARADIYLNRPGFEKTPITGEMLAYCARKSLDSTGIFLPVELALAQAQMESNMGQAGRSPTTNPFNVGEYDSGTVMWFDRTIDGVLAYYFLMCTQYLKCRDLSTLLVEFKNCAGYNYATDTYAAAIRQQYWYIQEWIDQQQLKIIPKEYFYFNN
jgi:hypothetical protein